MNHDLAMNVLANPNAYTTTERDAANVHVAECSRCTQRLANLGTAYMAAKRREEQEKARKVKKENKKK